MKKEKIKNIVFFSGGVNVRSGGPSGYIANLKSGIEALGIDDIKFIFKTIDNQELKLRKILVRLASFWIPIKSYRKKFRLYLSSKISGMAFDDTSLNSLYYKSFINELNKYEFDSITCHYVKDALFIRNYLNNNNSTAKLILMSHSPEPPSEEIYTSERANKNPYAEQNYLRWKNIEKEAFCDSADILLFPSEESIEPYYNALPYFKELLRRKKFLFLETGCCPLKTKNSYDSLRNKYNIKTKFVISYIGRHNKIKGYDLLQKIAAVILDKRNDVTFLIGGKISNEIQPLNNERWIELGFINPADVITISDCFILPNRQTYFDLVLLEVLSMGCPIFATKTGGNKAVFKRTHAIMLYENIDECVDKINKYLDFTIDKKDKLKKQIIDAYNKYYTIEVFAKNYEDMISKIK